MADKPFIPWYTSDFLNGIADLAPDEIGVYTVILNLLADQGAPIDDDGQWIGRRSNCSTRRCNLIINKLVSLGKIQRKNGLLMNRRMSKEIRKRQGKSEHGREAANAKWTKWREENKPQLPGFESGAEPDDEKRIGFISDLSRKKTGDKLKINDEINSEESQKTDDSDMHMQIDSRARVKPDSRIQSNNHLLPDSGRAREAQPSDRSVDSLDDLGFLLETVSRVAGFVPRNAKGYSDAVDLIKEWRGLEIDLNETIIPVIERIIAESEEPTSSLKRFDRAIRHEHAQKRAKAGLPEKPVAKPPDPIPKFDDEEEQHALLRKILIEKSHPQFYSRVFNRIKFRTNHDHDPPILVVEKRDGMATNETIDEVRFRIGPLAKRLGWSDVVW